MKLKIKDRKLLIDGRRYCDTSEPRLPVGKFKIYFKHSVCFNSLMPIIDVPDYKETVICWCKEMCKKEISCDYCDSIRVGRYFSGETLLECRGTFNQLYYKIRHGAGKDSLTLEIQ